MSDNNRVRADARKMTFTELGLARLRVPKVGQTVVWDSGTRGQAGLSVLASSGGCKTFRSTFSLHGKYISSKIGRVGELDLAQARAITLEYRRLAAHGVDPRGPRKSDKLLYSDVVDRFISEYARPRQRTWQQTQRILKHTAGSFMERDVTTITHGDVEKLLHSWVAEGHIRKATLTKAWLTKLFDWAYRKDLMPTKIMDKVDLHVEPVENEGRIYTSEEIRAIWNAAEQLDRNRGPTSNF
jgi:hypothetical protein